MVQWGGGGGPKINKQGHSHDRLNVPENNFTSASIFCCISNRTNSVCGEELQNDGIIILNLMVHSN